MVTYTKTIKAENWGFCGKMNTGKTFEALEIARQLQRITNRPILVFDPNKNSSYTKEFKQISLSNVAMGKMKPLGRYKLSGMNEYDLFFETVLDYVRNTIIVFDDCTSYMTGNVSSKIRQYIITSKNNENDSLFQFHNFEDMGPAILRSLQMLVIKEQSINTVPNKMRNRPKVQILLDEVVAENESRPKNEQWAYRIYDLDADIVYVEKDGRLVPISGKEYFK